MLFHSDNIAARLNLPNMQYAPDNRLQIYHAAQVGLASLEENPEKQRKYLDFIDFYAKRKATMLIANPIYDTVFKYLMDDARVARIIISTIIGEEIEELVFKQRERSAQIVSLGVSIFRLDFSAVVKTAEGQRRNVLIEIQKADSGDDLPRFRRYLAENYYSPGHQPSTEQTELIQDLEAPLVPIITIYILGFALENLKGYSAVIVRRGYYDAVTGASIGQRAEQVKQRAEQSEHLLNLKKERWEKLAARLEALEISLHDPD